MEKAKERPLQSHVFVVDDEKIVRDSTRQWLQLSGFEVRSFSSAAEALQEIDSHFDGVIISDVLMPGISGIEFLSQVLQKAPSTPVILLTAHGDVDMATHAMRLGAYDFIEKPYLPERLAESVKRASEKHRLLRENQALHQHLDSLSGLDATLIGISPAMKRLRTQLIKIADQDTNVVIYGETGTGKELVAQCLHDYSRRSDRHFVPINCAAIPESLIESELFGHEVGAFTGAQQKRIGKFEYADGGTLFLDEIEAMPQFLQVKILRALQEGIIERLGSNKPIKVNLRVVAASKVELRNNESFRQDLFYRLHVSELQIANLRDRAEDVPLLFDHYLRIAGADHQIKSRVLSSQDVNALYTYHWPGNVRELKNVAVKCALDHEQTVMGLLAPLNSDEVATLPDNLPPDSMGQATKLSLSQQVDVFEAELIKKALQRYQGNIKKTLEDLAIPRRTLNQKMAKYDISRSDFI